MRITVHVKPGKRGASVEQQADGSYIVAVTSQPEQGRANAAVIAALAEHFGVSKTSVTIVRGHTSRHKIIEIDDPSYVVNPIITTR